MKSNWASMSVSFSIIFALMTLAMFVLFINPANAQPLDTAAQREMGLRYLDGEGVDQDKKKAAAWFEQAARKSDAESQFQLAVLYSTGLGVKRDEARAVQLYRAAAEQGHAEAQYGLATKYTNGWGVGRDRIIALMWVKLALRNQNPGRFKRIAGTRLQKILQKKCQIK
ncbi:MAG: tetratricopeptide repeat protein [Methyloligellaceae bacterium]